MSDGSDGKGAVANAEQQQGAAASVDPTEGAGHTVSDSLPYTDNKSGSDSGNFSSLPYSDKDSDPVLVGHDEKYLCPVHKGLLRNPVQTFCGHRLCQDCVNTYLGEDEEKLCPAQEIDCVQVRRNNIYPDPGFWREMKQLLVYCPNKPCPEQKKLGTLEKHRAECEYRKVPCPYSSRGCDEVMQFRHVEEHKKNCNFRPVSCDLCGSEFNANEKQDHTSNICPEATVRCRYKCGKKLKRRQLEDHLQVCPKKPTECPYKSLGCTFEGSREDVKLHAKDINAHFEVLILFTVNAEMQKREATQQLQELMQAMDVNIKAIAALETEMHNIHRNLRLKLMQQVERTMELEQKLEEIQTSLREIPQLQQLGNSVEQLKALIPQLAHHDRQVASHEIRMAEMDLRFQMLETASYDGKLLWKIRDFSHRKRDAVQGRTVSLYSQPFYAGRFGYKMCARVYLNGDGIGRGTHMSLYFVVMKGEYDALLPWPFQRRVVVLCWDIANLSIDPQVSLILLDQSAARRHLKDEFLPDPTSTSFKRPENAEMNVASGCPLFVAHAVLDNADNNYIKDDTLFIKLVVDMSNMQLI
ncbi:tnf receptor-associated factor 3 [Plakobranchus ocellatus]|uniref:Tnf receptor-associated factor 3 n=1 Tax=Plakobranchus ocellatus TaxID=259542 RepID=A0AAV4BBL4_9GAST|nr:tnf receptor-associated factor 3 [Plakobranchus ocellatus]